MYRKQEIILKSYREGKSQRRISIDLKMSRKTVRKYIEAYQQHLKSGHPLSEVQSTYLRTAPVYKTGTRCKVKLTQELQASIDKLLSLNNQKKQQGLHKQMLKKKDILEELHRQDYDIGYTTVCNYIRAKESAGSVKEAYIRQSYAPGEVCEFDWGEVKLYLSGSLTRIQLAVFTSAYGNHRYGFLYHHQDTLSFMESHVRYFEQVGGVFKEMV